MTTTLQTVADLRAELAALGYWLDSLAAAVGTFNADRPRAFLGEVAKQLAARASTIRLLLGEEPPTALTLVEEMYRPEMHRKTVCDASGHVFEHMWGACRCGKTNWNDSVTHTGAEPIPQHHDHGGES